MQLMNVGQLWGNPNHMINIAKGLRAIHPPDKLFLLLAKRNAGSLTYDGIDKGGERLCAEIEDELRDKKFTKLSIVGYSLGGLVARYAVGLLQAKGILDQVQCMVSISQRHNMTAPTRLTIQNFTTFATPHLGVRTPLKGWYNHVWNFLGARTLSLSGRQLFTIDSFRDDGRPLLAVLADPKSKFMGGLRKFNRLSLYCNIVNDRTVLYYTSSISKTNPYRELDALHINFLEGFESVIIDLQQPFKFELKLRDRVSTLQSMIKWAKRITLILTLSVLMPVGIVCFLSNSLYQTIRSSSRIKIHDKGDGGIDISQYRIPLLDKDMRGEVEHDGETPRSANDPEHVLAEDLFSDQETKETDQKQVIIHERRMNVPEQCYLALTPDQFNMINSLNSLGWRKYPVWIRRVTRSHAAIVARTDNEAFVEGRLVLRHYAEKEFMN